MRKAFGGRKRCVVRIGGRWALMEWLSCRVVVKPRPHSLPGKIPGSAGVEHRMDWTGVEHLRNWIILGRDLTMNLFNAQSE